MGDAVTGIVDGDHRRWFWLVVPLAVSVAVMGLRWSAAGPEDEPSPIDITSTAPSFTSVDELAAASHLVVVATVIVAEPGRVITDPTDPTVGVQTTLYQLAVEEVLIGSVPGLLVLEHETSLLDGTMITVDGAPPPEAGERGLYFLITEPEAEFPHHAIINHQGRALVIDGWLRAPGDHDGLLEGRALAEVRDQLRQN